MGAAAAPSSALVTTLGGRPRWLVVLASVPVWSLLAVVEEHDLRIERPIDQEFLRQLRRSVEPGLTQAGFVFSGAFGGQRARRGMEDVVLYEAAAGQWPAFESSGPATGLPLWIRRDTTTCTMAVSIGGHHVADLLGDQRELAVRVGEVHGPTADAETLATALSVLFRRRP